MVDLRPEDGEVGGGEKLFPSKGGGGKFLVKEAEEVEIL